MAFKFTSLSNLSDLGNLKEEPTLPNSAIEAANFLLVLCHQATFLLNRQIGKMEEKFIQEGGYSENLFKRRLDKLK